MITPDPAFSPEERFAQFCLERGHTASPSRVAVVTAIFNLKRSFTTDDLKVVHEALRNTVSLSTLYRTLQMLLDAGMIRKDNQTYEIL